MNRIKELRLTKKLSLEDVARACDPPTTAKQIHRLELGERELTFAWIKRIRPALNAEPYEILPDLMSPKLKKLMALLERIEGKEKTQQWMKIGETLIDE